ncbi:L,D-transpeptidase family protein|uniref:L,D-transpeptidase family protein n=1 Tax=Noviherbaspirillum sp. L7-7A TaxID=2850560 RepID=UPI001C2C2E6B|nr:L,D-transpeptidase family protein [Noviherbaspirillum sp. L7-7A]MBV0878797.1 L,D-transpeptidase family protein [Noviherbaspirillum sp. L7-7A]
MRFRTRFLGGCLAAASTFLLAAPAAGTARMDPDQMLIGVYKDLGNRHLRDALAKADALVTAYPTFQLGHLIRGDLLLMQTQTINKLGAVEGAAPDALADLRQEAMARMRALTERPDPTRVPRAVLQLRPDQKRVLVADARRSRLYVYENRQGELRFQQDFYISQGKLGINKAREGDQKTPLGVYYITSRLAGHRLPDFYGVGALPLSYPNEWDKLQGREGSGIWLHGTPSRNYSRPPLSSDGCVVLTNPDLREVYAGVEINKTPVVIAGDAEFVPRQQVEAERAQAQAMVENWRAALEQQDFEQLRRHYASRFRSEQADTLDDWLARQQKGIQHLNKPALALRELSLFRYPGEEMIVATFTMDAVSGGKRSSIRKRQYWGREAGHWKIVSESGWTA